jgi:hypothetical protein
LAPQTDVVVENLLTFDYPKILNIDNDLRFSEQGECRLFQEIPRCTINVIARCEQHSRATPNCSIHVRECAIPFYCCGVLELRRIKSIVNSEELLRLMWI